MNDHGIEECEGVTRFEVIDHTADGIGRIVVRYDVKVSIAVQNEGRTLKVFLNDREGQ